MTTWTKDVPTTAGWYWWRTEEVDDTIDAKPTGEWDVQPVEIDEAGMMRRTKRGEADYWEKPHKLFGEFWPVRLEPPGKE